jgi:hypothetical protein
VASISFSAAFTRIVCVSLRWSLKLWVNIILG